MAFHWTTQPRAQAAKSFAFLSKMRLPSPLMLAQPDIEKTNLPLDRGANLNGRSKTKYSALMLACLYPGAAATVRLLLDRGAELRPPKGAEPLYTTPRRWCRQPSAETRI